MDKDKTGWIKDVHRFLGYGNPKASLVFMGLEEGGSEEDYPNDSERGEFADLATYIKSSEHCLAKIRTPVWRLAAALALKLLEPEQCVLTETVRDYRLNHLGRTNGETLLVELRAFRRPNQGGKYSLNQFSSRELALSEQAHKERHARLKSLFDRSHPKYVICYGKGAKGAFEEFWNLPPNEWSAVPISRHVVKLAPTAWRGVVALIPFLGRGGILAYSDVADVGARIKTERERILATPAEAGGLEG